MAHSRQIVQDRFAKRVMNDETDHRRRKHHDGNRNESKFALHRPVDNDTADGAAVRRRSVDCAFLRFHHLRVESLAQLISDWNGEKLTKTVKRITPSFTFHPLQLGQPQACSVVKRGCSSRRDATSATFGLIFDDQTIENGIARQYG